MTQPLLQVTGVFREYQTGDHVVQALKGVDFTVYPGEMVAIIGQSGSGKSTLMNILGCLDKPTRGTYQVAGRDVADMTPDELAGLRREHFGFIFQRYHLLADLDARGNVEVPAVYAGWEKKRRRQRSQALLERLGLGERIEHHPNQLSGGQQQRVSVARALMNGGEILLADEPTGALDSRSGTEMMAILQELSAEGHTVIVVTHDPKVAAHAQRIIEIRDGEIIADRLTEHAEGRAEGRTLQQLDVKESWLNLADRLSEAFRMAVLAMNAHRMRTFLTMLGIIIGIASVVTIVALGAGSQKAILGEINTMGSNTITVYPGIGAGDSKASLITTLNVEDSKALAQQPYVDSVTPTVATKGQLRYENITTDGNINGVGDQHFRVSNVKLAEGRFFGEDAVRGYAQEVVIDTLTATKLFPGQSPLGKTLFAAGVPMRVVGVTEHQQSTFFAADTTLQIWAPYTTVAARLLRTTEVKSVTVRITDGIATPMAESAITRLLNLRHGRQDFYLVSSDALKKTVEQVTLMLSLLIGAIGGISLMVGGLGVMNIMLVSVSERIKEIGVRTAIGARRSDIMSQFIIEAVLVCLLGGIIGVGVSLGFGALLGHFIKAFSLVYSPASIIAAFLTASLIGLVFGWLPARNASRLDPVEALSRE